MKTTIPIAFANKRYQLWLMQLLFVRSEIAREEIQANDLNLV